MDLKLLALTLDLQRKAAKLSHSDNLEMKSAALDMLDYLGQRIDAAASAQKAPTD